MLKINRSLGRLVWTILVLNQVNSVAQAQVVSADSEDLCKREAINPYTHHVEDERGTIIGKIKTEVPKVGGVANTDLKAYSIWSKAVKPPSTNRIIFIQGQKVLDAGVIPSDKNPLWLDAMESAVKKNALDRFEEERNGQSAGCQETIKGLAGVKNAAIRRIITAAILPWRGTLPGTLFFQGSTDMNNPDVTATWFARKGNTTYDADITNPEQPIPGQPLPQDEAYLRTFIWGVKATILEPIACCRAPSQLPEKAGKGRKGAGS